MDNNKKNSRPADTYEEQYRQQLEKYSKMAQEDSASSAKRTQPVRNTSRDRYYRDDGYNDGYNESYDESYDDGYYDGYDDGYDEYGYDDRDDYADDPRERTALRPRSSGSSRRSRPVKRSSPISSHRSSNSDKRKKKSKKKKRQRSAARREVRHYSRDELHFGNNRREERRVETAEKRHPVSTFFRTLILLILVIFIGANGLMYYYISLVNVRDRGQRSYTSGSLHSSDVTNILLIGSDARDPEEFGRTDTMMILSVNKSKKTITLTSLMRDMYVEIAGYDHDGNSVDFWDKLNAAYVHGGAELLMDTIEYNFDISVDDYAYVDFYAFVDIVDAIGGIEVDVTDEEAAGMEDPMGEQNWYMNKPSGTDYLDHGGHLNLNGNQALAYARLRYVGNADFQRTERQREVINKIVEKVKHSDPLTINRFARASCSHLTTNMDRPEMMIMVYKALFSMNYEMRSLRIPPEDCYWYGEHDGQSTLDVDLDACREVLRSELY